MKFECAKPWVGVFFFTACSVLDWHDCFGVLWRVEQIFGDGLHIFGSKCVKLLQLTLIYIVLKEAFRPWKCHCQLVHRCVIVPSALLSLTLSHFLPFFVLRVFLCPLTSAGSVSPCPISPSVIEVSPHFVSGLCVRARVYIKDQVHNSSFSYSSFSEYSRCVAQVCQHFYIHSHYLLSVYYM